MRMWRSRARVGQVGQRLLLACTLLSSAGVLLILVFVLSEAVPALPDLPGREWNPEEGRFGVLPMLWGSLGVTVGALMLAVPAGIGTALFLTEIAPPMVGVMLRPVLQALAGVPSVVYGFVALSLLVPAIRVWLGGPGFSLLAGALVLAVMILPTIAAVTEDALRALPGTYREGAAALGATAWQAAYRLLLPAARSGVIAAVVLGLGRALGETMAVLMVTGNVAAPPTSVLEPVRTLTGSIAMEIGYATGHHRSALFATGLLLLTIVMLVNTAARRMGQTGGRTRHGDSAERPTSRYRT